MLHGTIAIDTAVAMARALIITGHSGTRPPPPPPPGPEALVGRGAARGRAIQPSVSKFFGLVFLLAPAAGLGAWVGVTGRSHYRARFSILAELSLPIFRA